MKGKRKFIISIGFLLIGFLLAAGAIYACRDKPSEINSALTGVGIFMGCMFPGVGAIMAGYALEYKFDPKAPKPPEPREVINIINPEK